MRVRIFVVCWDSYAPLLKAAARETDVDLSLITFHPLDKDQAARDRVIDEIEAPEGKKRTALRALHLVLGIPLALLAAAFLLTFALGDLHSAGDAWIGLWSLGGTVLAFWRFGKLK